jgi:hypothetical protein
VALMARKAPQAANRAMRMRVAWRCDVDRLEVRVSITKLLLALIILIVPMSIAGLILTQHSDQSLDNAIGANFKTMAEMFSNEVSQYMLDRVNDVVAMSSDPAIVQAVSAGNHSGENQAAEQKAATAAKGSGVAAGILGNSASQVLRRRRDLDPRFLRIVATNDAGAVVAATHNPAAGSYARNEAWQGVFNNGQGAIKIGGILSDEFSKSSYVTIGVPVPDPASSATIGVLSAAVDITALLSRFRQSQISNGARAWLVNEDAHIISGPSADVFARVQSPEFGAIHDSVGLPEGTQSGWTRANLASGRSIVGYAGTGLKKTYDNLGWYVLVSQDERQATAPIRVLSQFALLMVVLALCMLTLLSVYYYLHRTQRFSHLAEDFPVDHGRTATAT